MRRLFACKTRFNEEIGPWSMASVTSMREMFCGATAFNQPLPFKDMANVTDMRQMFYCATAFNQPLDFDTANVTNMVRPFSPFFHPRAALMTVERRHRRQTLHRRDLLERRSF